MAHEHSNGLSPDAAARDAIAKQDTHESLSQVVARALVVERAAERERCAKIAEDSAPATQDGFGDYGSELCEGLAAAIRNQEPRR